MTLFIESFKNESLTEVVDFFKTNSELGEKMWGWEVSRFVDWYWGSHSLIVMQEPDWYKRNCSLVRCEGKLQAVIISEEGGKEVSVIMEKVDRRMFKEIFMWLKAQWLPLREGLDFEFSDKMTWLADFLKAQGLKASRQVGHEWEYDLTAGPDHSELAEGWRVTSLAENQDNTLFGIAQVIKNAFNSKNTLEKIVNVLENLKNNPVFRPELSVFTQNEKGMIASYCRGTANPVTGVAAIDPVCCHPDFQRKGLTKALIQECFRRQASLGAKRCYIGSAPMPAPSTFLYKALKPADYNTMDRWSMEL